MNAVNGKKKTKWIIWWIIMTVFFLFSTLAAYYTTKNVKATIIVAFLALTICLGITSFISQWKEVILSVVMLLLITYLDTSTVNTIVIVVLFNTIYINLVFNPSWDRRKERLQVAIDKDKSNNKLTMDNSLFEEIKSRNKTISTMLMYSLSVLPSITLKVLQEKKDMIFNIKYTRWIYLNYLKVFKISDNSPVELKRLLVGVLLFLFFMSLTLVLCFALKEQRLIQNKIRMKRQRDDSYWENTKPNLEPFDLLFIDKDLSDSDFYPTPSENGVKCKWNGNNSRYEIHCDECNHYLECFPDSEINNSSYRTKTEVFVAEVFQIINEE